MIHPRRLLLITADVTQFIMWIQWIHVSLLFLVIQTSLAASAGQEKGNCRTPFEWDENLKDVKLLDDCDLLKDKLTLKPMVGRIADRTECIDYIDLNIHGTQMERWMNGGESFDGRSVTFDNKLALPRPRRQVQLVTLTARNKKRQNNDFVSRFKLDPTNCTEDGGNGAVNDTTTEKGDGTNSLEEGKISRDGSQIPIIAGIQFGSTLLVAVAAVVGIICWKKRRDTVLPILNLFLRGAKIVNLPQVYNLLGEGARPRRCQSSRGLPGAREADQRPSGARGRYMICGNSFNKTISGQRRRRPFSA